MTNIPNTIVNLKPSKTGVISNTLITLLLASQLAHLTNCFQINTPTAPCELKEPEESLPEHHFLTENWVSSPEHETAVLLDIRSAGLTPTKALSGLSKLYHRKEDIMGVRVLGNGSKILIVFANAPLQEHALLYGFQLEKKTIIYPTKALDSQYSHTLFIIEGLIIDDALTTRQKLEASLNALFFQDPDTRNDQPQHQRPESNPWPPTVHDVFFHQSNGGFYDGTVTVVLRGSATFLKRCVRLESFDNCDFNCRVHRISSYCHHCKRMDRHNHRRCPHVCRESS